ncbi:MAG: histidine--tRNA ligase [Thiohalomonadales bacterium]
MPKIINAIRGMNDLVPEFSYKWQFVENVFKELIISYGYQEIRMPIVEKTELFKRSIGEVTDIVEKEMYTFEDRNGDSLTLRPEGTASCVRACIENGLIHNQQQRLWYHGPMFRHERPQKGRYRQFFQFGVEVFGISGPDIDAELISLTDKLWKKLGIHKDVSLEINSLGISESRVRYREVLVEYFTKHHDQLDADSQRRLLSNPMRILDSKNPDLQILIEAAPKLYDFLDTSSKEHFISLCAYLDSLKISYKINHRLVRGLDYYSKTVFEWVTDKLGAQGTICAGGRYDALVAQIGGRETPAVGFAMGLERIIELIPDENIAKSAFLPEIYMILAGESAEKSGIMLAENLRDSIADIRLQMHCGGGSFKSQMKKADKSGASIALIIGDNELSNSEVSIKYLREDKPQQIVKLEKLSNFLINLRAAY